MPVTGEAAVTAARLPSASGPGAVQGAARRQLVRRSTPGAGGRDVGQGMDDVLDHLAVYLPENLQAVLVRLVAVAFSGRVS